MQSRSVILLEGGGLRGAFSAGVLSELERQGHSFSDLVAVSSAAPSAVYFAAGQMADAVRIWRDHTHSGQLVDPLNVFRGRSILDVDRLIGVFRTTVPLRAQALESGRARVHIGVTDCASGLPHYVAATPRNVFELMRATMALPIAYGKIVNLDECAAVDGGVAAPVALDYARGLRPERLLVVLTRPRGYRRRNNWIGDRVIGLSYLRHVNMRRAMTRHSSDANLVASLIEQLEDDGAISVVRPDQALPAGRLTRDPTKIHATLGFGVAAARSWLERS